MSPMPTVRPRSSRSPPSPPPRCQSIRCWGGIGEPRSGPADPAFRDGQWSRCAPDVEPNAPPRRRKLSLSSHLHEGNLPAECGRKNLLQISSILAHHSPSGSVIRTGEILRVSEPQHIDRPKVEEVSPVPRILGAPDLASSSVHNGDCRSPSSPRSGHLGGVQLLSHNCPDFRISPGGFGVNMMEAHDVGDEAAPKAERLGRDDP